MTTRKKNTKKNNRSQVNSIFAQLEQLREEANEQDFNLDAPIITPIIDAGIKALMNAGYKKVNPTKDTSISHINRKVVAKKACHDAVMRHILFNENKREYTG